MDWSKYTLNEWIKQYGLYTQNCLMRGGHCPDDLRKSSLYRLISENNSKANKTKVRPRCVINDYEADQVRQLIVKFKNDPIVCDVARSAVTAYFEKNLRGMSIRQVADELGLGKATVEQMLCAGEFYMAGHDKRLRIK